MLHVAKPTVTPLDVFRVCYTGVQDIGLRTRLAHQEATIEAKSAAYERAASDGEAPTLAGSDFEVPGVSSSEIDWLYSSRLVRSRSGRKIYLALRESAREGLCSHCGVRDASTLDHYLAKAQYHALAVNPLNLLPACFECNHKKGSTLLDTPHPYFDAFHAEAWLSTTVLPTTPPSITYQVKPPSSWSATLTRKVRAHFEAFGLDQLYSAQASRYVSGMRGHLGRIFSLSGAAGVREEVGSMRESWEAVDLNCWEAAMFRGLQESDWFCEGGCVS